MMTQIIDRYQIISEIGSGGFATVFKAVDQTLEREVALKVIRPLLMSDPQFVTRFQREAKVVARLQHPNIIPVYDYGESEGRLFLVMKLLPGSVASLLQKGPLPWEQAMTITAQVATGLDFAHGRGLIHRDIKPDNILLDELGNAVLADFGLVKALEQSTISISFSGGILGTPQYIAPEIWNGESATAATDIYSLACLLYVMVTGEKLFDGLTPPAIMAQHFRPPQLPTQWREGVPSGLGEVLRQALAQNPQDRPVNAGMFATACEQLVLDPHAEQYADLQTSLAAEKWTDAITIAEKILEQDAGYRDVPALLAQALAEKTQADHVAWVMQWQEQAETAIVNGEWQTAMTAVQRWLQLVPDSQAAHNLLTQAQTGKANSERLDEIDKLRDKVEQALQAKKWDVVLVTAQHWQELDPDNVEVLEILQQAESEKAQAKKKPTPASHVEELPPLSSRMSYKWIWRVAGLFLLVLLFWGGRELFVGTGSSQTVTPTVELSMAVTIVENGSITPVTQPTETITPTPEDLPTKTRTSATETVTAVIVEGITPTPSPSRTPTRTPRPSATPTRTPVNATPGVRVASGSINVRSGPGTAYPVITVLQERTTATLIAKSANGLWYNVLLDTGVLGWVSTSGVELSNTAPNNVDVVLTVPALPTATAFVSVPTTTSVGDTPVPTTTGGEDGGSPPSATNTPIPVATDTPVPDIPPTRPPTPLPP